jgi:hypothetical protein
VISGTFTEFFNSSILRSGTGTLTLQANNFRGIASIRNTNDMGSVIAQGNERYRVLYVYNDANSSIDLAHSGGNTSFQELVQFQNSQNGTISIGLAGGTATLESFGSLAIADSGMGTVSLNNLTVNGVFNSLATIFTGTTHLTLANCTFNSIFALTVPRLTCGTGNQFNSEFLIDITGSQPSVISGTFTEFFNSSILRSGTGTLTLQANNFRGIASIRNTNNMGSVIAQGNERYRVLYVYNDANSSVDLAHSGGNTSFQELVQLQNNSQNGTISIGAGGGTATLESSASLAITDSSTGAVSLNNLTVNGTYNPTLTVLTGSSAVHLANCTFNTTFSQTVPRITCGTGNRFNSHFSALVTGDQPSTISAIFNQTAEIIRNGTGNLSISSSNFFNSTLVRNESIPGSLELSQNTFNQSVTFTRTSGMLQPCTNGTCTFRGNITVNTGSSGTDFVIGTPTQGIVLLEGDTDQNFNGSGSANIIIHRMQLDKSASVVKVNTPLSVATSLAFMQGIIRTTEANFVRFLDGAIVSGASATGYVEGPVRKLGDEAFVFPVGDGGVFRPIAISAAASVTDEFTARFFRTAQPFGGPASYAAPLLTVSTCEYWTLDRTAGTSNVFVTLGWQSMDCPGPYITEPPTLHVARWNGTQWVSHGQGSFTGTSASGTVTSSAVVSSFSPFALGSTSLSNPLPIRLLDFSAQAQNGSVALTWRSATELNSDYYEIQRSATGAEFRALDKVAAAGDSYTAKRYSYTDTEPLENTSYYRLKMVDRDGSTEFSNVVLVNFASRFQIYPNPVVDVVHLTEKRAVRISDLLGVIHLESLEPTREIAIPGQLAAGNYILQTDRGEVYRIVILR